MHPVKRLFIFPGFLLLSVCCLINQLANAQLKKLVVAQDGTGNYKTVQEAFNAIPPNNKKPVLVFVKKGVYREKLYLDSMRNFVILEGEDKFTTILIWNDHTGKVSPSGDSINTRTSWSCKITADNFTARNITFGNDAGFTAGQAV